VTSKGCDGPNFSIRSTSVCIHFNLTDSDQIRHGMSHKSGHVGGALRRVFMSQMSAALPSSYWAGPQRSQIFGTLLIRTLFWPRTTKFSVVTHLGKWSATPCIALTHRALTCPVGAYTASSMQMTQRPQQPWCMYCRSLHYRCYPIYI